MRGPRRSDELARHLREQITSGDIASGEKLPSESALISEHGVSRTVVREALGRLHAEGLISTRRGLGSFALTPPPQPALSAARTVRSLQDRLDLIDYRTALEPAAAAAAARRVTAGEVSEQQLIQLHIECDAFAEASQNPALAIQHDFALHRRIAALSGNPYLLDALEALGPVMIAMPRARLTTNESNQGRGGYEIAALEHQQLVEAIAAGDAAGASAAALVHLTNSRRRIIRETT